MGAVIWHLMMLFWLAAWVFAVWWAWPRFQRLELTGETIMVVFWLMLGAVAWVAAFIMGKARYWRR